VGESHASRLLVTGSTGYLGRELLRRAPDATGTGGRAALDVRDAAAVDRLLDELRPTAVIHTAYLLSGSDAWSTNVDGAANVARAAARVGARLVHVSTDVVFDGRRGRYREDDPLSPLHDYGRSKAEAERVVAATAPDASIVRTSLIYGGAEPSKHELDARAAAYPFFRNELRSPVQVTDLADALLELAALDHAGPLHVAGADDVDRWTFACLIRGDEGAEPAVADGATRPLDCTLDSSRARALLRTRLRGVREVL
jgi:dTDP-4-dehydrorhamnose reductase